MTLKAEHGSGVLRVKKLLIKKKKLKWDQTLEMLALPCLDKSPHPFTFSISKHLEVVYDFFHGKIYLYPQMTLSSSLSEEEKMRYYVIDQLEMFSDCLIEHFLVKN